MGLQVKWAAVLAAFLLAALVAPGGGAAQVRPLLPTPYKDDPYVAELVKILDEWNAKTLVLPSKGDLKERFEKRLSEVLKARRYSYQDEAWVKEMRARFDKMPSFVKPELRIDAASQLTLTVLFLKDIAVLQKQMKAAQVREALMLPVFLVFGTAQNAAKEAKKAEIESTQMTASLLYWWTTTWPFCD